MNLFGIEEGREQTPEELAAAMAVKLNEEAGVTRGDIDAAAMEKVVGPTSQFEGELTAPVMPMTRGEQEYETNPVAATLKKMLIPRPIYNHMYGENSEYLGNVADFKMAQELYKQQELLRVMDPQVEELAQRYEAEGNTLMAAKLRAANKVDPIDMGDYSLAPGTSRFEGGSNSLLNHNPAKPVDNSTANQRDARDLATSVGLDISKDANGNWNNDEHAKAYGGILAASAKGTITTVNADGSETHINDIPSAMARAREIVERSSQAPTAASGTQGGNGVGATGTPAALSTVDIAMNKKMAEDTVEAEDSLAYWGEVGGVLDTLGTWEKGKTDAESRFITSEQTKDIYGPADAYWPDGLRNGGEKDAIAQINRLNSLLSVEARQKLQGQGQITEGEQAMLSSSLSALVRMRDGMSFGGGISDELVAKELGRIYRIMEKAQEKAKGFLVPTNTWKDASQTEQGGVPSIESLVKKHTRGGG